MEVDGSTLYVHGTYSTPWGLLDSFSLVTVQLGS